MRRLAKGCTVVFFGLGAWFLMQPDAHAQKRRIHCGGSHRLTITDLDMSPDPIARGQRIQRFRVIVEVDGTGGCDTIFEIRENPAGDLVARGLKKVLRPGRNVIEFKPISKYHFRSGEHCFQVVADIAGSQRAVDASQRFCARETSRRGRWTMREADDRPIRRLR